MTTSNYDRILQYCKVINSKPNHRTSFFFLDEHCRMMMIELSKVVTPSHQITQLSMIQGKDQAYLFIDLEDTKKIRAFGFNVVDQEKEIWKDEFEVTINWNVLDDLILAFFRDYIDYLTMHVNPKLELEKMIAEAHTRGFGSSSRTRHNSCDDHIYSRASSQRTYSSLDYDYRERDKVLDPLFELIKQSKTGQAIEYVDQHLGALVAEKKISLLNGIFRMLALEKLDLLTMVEMLKITAPVENDLYERREFLGKVKQFLIKAHHKRAKTLWKMTKHVPPPVVPAPSTEQVEDEEEEVEEASVPDQITGEI